MTVIVTHGIWDEKFLTPQVSGCHWSEFDYFTGDEPPHYPLPALRTDFLYWRMPAYPTENLIAQWYLWNQGHRNTWQVFCEYRPTTGKEQQ